MRLAGVDRETAVVFIPGSESQPPRAIYCVPTTVDDTTGFEQRDSETAITRQIATRSPTTAVGQHVTSVLADQLESVADGQLLLVAREIPHDTAVFLQQAGYELQSTAAVRNARASKTPAERDSIAAVQAAATDGMARAETVLAKSVQTDDGLAFEGRPLSAERLRQTINSELAASGVSPAANTRIETPAKASSKGLAVGEPICIHLAPRGSQGYHGHLTRTLAVDSEGGWERRAHVAVEAGLRAAARHIEPGVDIATVEGEIVAEVGAYGFAVGQPADRTQTRATASVHGVGLSTYERPTPAAGSTLHEDAVVAVSAGVVDPTRGAVRVGTVRTITAEGSRRLVTYRSSLPPTEQRCTDSDRQ